MSLDKSNRIRQRKEKTYLIMERKLMTTLADHMVVVNGVGAIGCINS